MTKKTIIGIGSPLVDSLLEVSEQFIDGIDGEKGGMELVEIDHINNLVTSHDNSAANAPGGSAANTIVAMSRLGMDCTFLGKIGQDKEGDFYKDQFTKSGVSVERFKHSDSAPTGRCLSMITPDSQRTCRTFLGAAMDLSHHEITVKDFEGCHHAHIEGYLLFNQELTMKVLQCAEEANCTISLDLASFEVVNANRDLLDEILNKFIDIVFANEDEAEAYCGSSDPLVGLETLSKHCEISAVKLGAEGAYIRRGDEVVKIETEEVRAIDTTGAGDLWAAGFLHAYYNGHSLDKCGTAGSHLGSGVVQHIGAMIPDELWPELKNKISNL